MNIFCHFFVNEIKLTLLPGGPAQTGLPGDPAQTALPGDPAQTALPGDPTETALPGDPTETGLPRDPAETGQQAAEQGTWNTPRAGQQGFLCDWLSE